MILTTGIFHSDQTYFNTALSIQLIHKLTNAESFSKRQSHRFPAPFSLPYFFSHTVILHRLLAVTDSPFFSNSLTHTYTHTSQVSSYRCFGYVTQPARGSEAHAKHMVFLILFYVHKSTAQMSCLGKIHIFNLFYV